MAGRTRLPGLAGALVVATIAAPSVGPASAEGAAAVTSWSTPGTYSYTPPDGVNGALVYAIGASGAGTWTGVNPSPGASGGGGALVIGFIPVAQAQSPWTVVVGGGGSGGNFSDSGPTAAGGGGSSGVYPGSAASSVIAGGGGGGGGANTGNAATGDGGSAGNPDGSGQAGAGPDAGNGGAGGIGGSGTGDWEGKGSSGGNGDGGAGGAGCCGGSGGSGPARGGVGGSAGQYQRGGGGGGGYGGGASGGALSLFNNVGGGGGGGGSYAPSFPGFPGPVYDTTGTNFNGVDGSVEIITVAPALDVTVEPVANGSVAIDWQEPTQAEELGTVTYQAMVDGQAMLSAPGVVTGLDPTTPVEVTVLAQALALTAETAPVSATPAVTPTVTGVVPTSGSTAGNYSITISGTGFLDPATVTVGGNNATDVTVVSHEMITATVPGGVAGPATVAVTNTSTGLGASVTDGFSYFVPGPPVEAPAFASTAIAGTPRVGSPSVVQASVTGDPAPTLTYEWQTGPAAIGPWTTVPGATAAGIVPTADELGDYLRVTVTATNGVDPPATSSVVTSGPVVGTRARIGDVGVVGDVAVGKTLTATVHGVAGVPAPTLTYQWQANVAGSWTSLPGQTAQQLTVGADHVGQQLRVVVTGNNGVDDPAVSRSPATVAVRGTAPAVGTASVTGTPAVGKVLTAQVTGVGGTPSPRFRYQWQRGGGEAGSWRDIAGQDNASLTVPAAAAGESVRVVVTATNGVTPRAWAMSTGQVVPIVAPSIGEVLVAGKAQIGKTLTAVASGVAGDPAPAVSYQWQRRKPDQSWRSISGADQDSLTVKRAWYRQKLRVAVTATVGSDPTTKSSPATAKVRGARPTLTAISPGRGPKAGGTQVRLRGTGFLPGVKVRIGGAKCRISSVSSSRIKCQTSARRIGHVAVVVRNTDGRDATLPQSFRYRPR